MRIGIKIAFISFCLLTSIQQYAQHRSQMVVEVNMDTKMLTVQQEINYFNESDDVLNTVVLNDWNNGYSNVKSPLAERFSDEFYRGFHLAKEEERGHINNLTLIDDQKLFLSWLRTDDDPDVILVTLRKPLAPNEKTTIHLTYTVKIPSDKFTRYGYDTAGGMNLKTWYLTPARYINHQFVKYANENLDDSANAVSNFDIELKVPKGLAVTTDLNATEPTADDAFAVYRLSGKNRVNFSLFIEPTSSFKSFKSNTVEVITNFQENKISIPEQSIVINSIINYVNEHIGTYPFEKIVVSQTEYDRNPFYGLNQLPSFISPFSDEFTFEIKFLKTYLNVYLKNSLRADIRKEGWMYDAIQVYTMMKYIDINHPNSKMLGSAANFKLLKSFHLTNLDFNEQYSYFYMLMARKNLDQALGDPKNTLVKFNEQIASKYRAGLSLRFLDSYLEKQAVDHSVEQFYSLNKERQTAAADFENLLKTNASKDINWFFETIIKSRAVVDYKFAKVARTKDSIYFSLKNKTGIVVPVPVYGIKKGDVVFKKWLEPTANDSTYRMSRNEADKIILNYKNEVPEYNLRNNWKSLKSFFPNNRPIKFVFMKDLEDPYYNQILYVPSLGYNLYDGFSPGLRLHNKTILEKPFIFDINPAYSTKTETFSGSGGLSVNQNYRDGALYNIKYAFSGSYFHYAPDAFYLKLNPTISFRFREANFRDNRKQLLLLRQVVVNKDESKIVVNNSSINYSVFNAKYYDTKTEVTKHLAFMGDAQVTSNFGKLATELEYRKLFENNRQINLRLYAGAFLYNTTNSDYFSFALDRPTDYLFDYNYYGRSEDSGFFSQQLILAEGGFKSRLATPFANQWISTINGGYTIWNFIEAYGDIGLLKNKFQKETFLFDSGIRLNLVTDYFEVYFPVYSSNGWEVGQKNYNEKIRFIITLSPKILFNLFNRKWF